jgi:outer membrane lipoprotein
MKSKITAVAGLLCVGVFLMSASCTYPVSKQLRDEAKRQRVTLPMVLEDPTAHAGTTVVWGGEIIETINHRDGTDIIVLDAPLDYMLVPQSTHDTRGRFIARSTEFVDPALYETDREVTVAGEIIGAEERALGQTTYRYPVVQIKELHLWEKRYYYHYPPDYYWYPWYPSFYGSFYYSSAHFHHGHGGHGEGHDGEGHHH